MNLVFYTRWRRTVRFPRQGRKAAKRRSISSRILKLKLLLLWQELIYFHSPRPQLDTLSELYQTWDCILLSRHSKGVDQLWVVFRLVEAITFLYCYPYSASWALFLDTCSVHGTKKTIPTLRNVDTIFLPPCSTTKLHPSEAVIIATMKNTTEYINSNFMWIYWNEEQFWTSIG